MILDLLTRPSRNQKGILPQKSPHPPFVKGGQGGIYREHTGFFLLANMLISV